MQKQVSLFQELEGEDVFSFPSQNEIYRVLKVNDFKLHCQEITQNSEGFMSKKEFYGRTIWLLKKGKKHG